MGYQISRGVIAKPQKVVLYGPEGIGKTTFASHFPSPLFIDTEDGSASFDVPRLPTPTSWQMLLDEVRWVRDYPAECGGTLVVDTLDWAERLCADHVCKANDWASIETPGYGKGYTYLKEEFGKLLNALGECVERGLNVCCTAHAQIVKFERPDEAGAYDRWELKLSRKQVAPMVKEWADALLFADYKTIVITKSDKSGNVTKAKATGGRNRVLHTTHAATWDAKNRWGLQDEVPMEFAQISAHIPVPGFDPAQTIARAAVRVDEMERAEHGPSQTEVPADYVPDDGIQTPKPAIPDHLRPILDLMATDGVSEEQVRWAMAQRGYVTEDTPLSSYAPDLAGWMQSVWPQLVGFIRENYKAPTTEE